MVIELLNHHFTLLAQKAIVWQEKNTLLIADLHLGKVTHFRKEGVAIPSAALSDNFKHLNDILLSHVISRIIFLGDLFHNRLNAEWDLFCDWRKMHHTIEMLIVLGNHDIIPTRLFDEIGITVCKNEYCEEQFVFSHHPIASIPENQFVFCGHIHPVFFLKSTGKQRIKLPCFVQDPSQCILPSFGVFTGGYPISTENGRNVFLIAEDRIFKESKK